MPKFRSFSLYLFVIVAAFAMSIAAPIAYAQTLASSAVFSGSASDSSGARISNATVVLTSPDKGITRTFKTDAEGDFSFVLLPGSIYTLTVYAQRFTPAGKQGITLEA